MKIKYDFSPETDKGYINFEDLNDKEFEALRALFQALIRSSNAFTEQDRLLQELSFQRWINKLSNKAIV